MTFHDIMVNRGRKDISYAATMDLSWYAYVSLFFQSELRFQTRFSGVLTARRSEIRERMAIQMRLPLNRPTETFQLSKPSPVWDIVRRTLGRTHGNAFQAHIGIT